MRDLLKDLNDSGGLDSLANLEKELDNVNGLPNSSTTFMSPPPPGISSMATPSAGAMVVGNLQPNSNNMDSLPTSQDAFTQSLQQFSAWSLTDDFLKADSERKQTSVNLIQDLETKKNEELLIQSLFEGEEDYDVQASSEKVTSDNMAKLFSGLATAANVTRDNTNVATNEPSVPQQPVPHGPGRPVPGPMQSPVIPPPMVPPGPPHMMMGMPPPGSMPPPHMMMGMPPHHFLPPVPLPPPHAMMMMQQHQQMHLQHQAIIQQQIQRQNQGLRPSDPSTNQKKFSNSDFPALGATEMDIEKERFEESKRMEEKPVENASRKTGPRSANDFIPRHMTFSNPNPNAPPVPATAIYCTSMTPRDLCYVLHSMMRPILSYASILDAYNADYYRWSFEDRNSHNLLYLGRPVLGMQSNLPKPVWKETKVKAQELEESMRDKLEKRAENWTKEKQALGRVVKINVKRPKALLSTTTLSTSVDGKQDDGLLENSDEDRQRFFLWAARLAIDKGFQAYLNLVELRRLLQSRPDDALMEEEDRRKILLVDVEQNVNKLQATFGIMRLENDSIDCDHKLLSRTLTLSKGRVLLARVIDEGFLPHASACRVLPSAIKVAFEFASTANLEGVPPAGEDRLFRSLLGLVKTARPSVDAQNLLACLNSATDADNVLSLKSRTMKSVLASKRTLMELLHAIFERGGAVCVGTNYEVEWKEKESKFLSILAKA